MWNNFQARLSIFLFEVFLMLQRDLCNLSFTNDIDLFGLIIYSDISTVATVLKPTWSDPESKLVPIRAEILKLAQ